MTRDYLQATPWDALIARINDLYQTELEPYSTKLVELESLGGTRTRVVIGPNQVDSETNTAPPIERTEYFYDRLDLATFFKGPTLKQLGGFTLPADSFKILDAISELNDINFTLNDFLHVRYDAFGQTYQLEANPKSMRFVGAVQFQLVNTSKRLLSNLGSAREFPKANPAPLGTSGTKRAAQYMTSGFDFTGHRDFIKILSKDSVWLDGRKMAAILQDVTKRPWVCSITEAEWNIAYEAKSGEGHLEVMYNGIVLPRFSPRKDMQRVLVLRLSELSTNVDGYLLLHYN
jgi:hypothetical protein